MTALNMAVITVQNGNLNSTSSTATLKNIFTARTARIDTLTDVTADNSNTVSGSTLVYDSEIDKYVVKLIDIDGGTF